MTGSFGSGCTTFGRAMETLGFKYFRLSDPIYEEWKRKHRGKSIDDARRDQLQTIGDNIRKKHEADYFAIVALRKARNSRRKIKRVVFDSIRNTAEVKVFRDTFPNFFLIAVDALKDNRRKRLKNQYAKWKLPERNFDIDDERDKNEQGLKHGQQVQLCVDEADVLISNDVDHPSEGAAIQDFIERTKRPYIDLLSGEELRPPTPDESYMSIAYSASLLSKCVKRQVGAVILDKNGRVLSVGYNENPKGKPPCIELYKMCYRDIYKQKLFRDLRNQECPNCRKELGELKPPYICPNCKLDLDRFYVRDKAMARCTAIHAEEKAIINADGKTLKDSTLYVTTFPCFMCSHRILDVEISSIIYSEPYPDIESELVLKEAQTKRKDLLVERFEGVKSRAYFRLFSSWRKIMEAKALSVL